MILVRQVFQIKYGHMDEVLDAMLPALHRGQVAAGITRILTDISGQNFTLVSETRAESLDAFWEALQASFEDTEMAEQMNRVLQYVESGHREFYTIEYEAGD
jgi:hypothetical protein